MIGDELRSITPCRPTILEERHAGVLENIILTQWQSVVAERLRWRWDETEIEVGDLQIEVIDQDEALRRGTIAVKYFDGDDARLALARGRLLLCRQVPPRGSQHHAD